MFKKYSSLTNTYMGKAIESIRNSNEVLGGWEVSEKLHGANFSFIVTADDIELASRNGIIESKFYNCREAVDALLPKVRALFDQLQNLEVLTIYGEIYGDGVQKGVKYFDTQRFAAFDVAVDGLYCDPSVFHKFMDMVDIPRVHSFGFFSFDEAMQVSNEFVTNHSLDRNESNICEGVVIKPARGNAVFHNGSRMILKNKNTRFSEKAKEAKPARIVELSDEDQLLLNLMQPLINENRINAVLSKEADLRMKLFGKYLGLVRQDVLADLEEQVKLHKLLQSQVDKLILPILRPRLLELCS